MKIILELSTFEIKNNTKYAFINNYASKFYAIDLETNYTAL